LIFFTLIIIAIIGAPDTEAANGIISIPFEISSDLISTSGVISSSDSGIEIASNNKPWSTERMENAQPYPLPELDSAPEILGDFSQNDEDPVFIPSIPPSTNQNLVFGEYDTFDQSSVSNSNYTKPAPYTRYENFDSYQVFPYSTIGVLFFTQKDIDYRCSAAVVGENALWTAGHCVHDGMGDQTGWSENVVFIPAYKDGNEPYGRWIAENLYTRWYWFNNQDLRFDIGGVVLEPNGLGQSVQDVVGSLGFAYNIGSNQHWFNFGYPSDFPFDGKTMQVCAGSFARVAEDFSYPNPIGMGCDMTKGSSGGPWIINFSGFHGNTNFLNGNNSFRFTSEPEDNEEIFSPYFGATAKDLFDSISSNDTIMTDFNIPIVMNNHESCDASYPDFCIPPPPPYLSCGDIEGKNFTVLPPDPHGFDGDRDGIGCED
jgi:V8-like Glu-specific endopeptidase